MKKKITLLLATLALAAVCTGCGVKQINDETTVEAGQELKLAATDFFDIKAEKADEVTFDVTAVDVNTVGQYETIATYGNKDYIITVNVEDTTAPMIEHLERYVITNDITAYDPMQLVDGIYDASEYTVAFTRYEKTGTLDVMDDAALKALTDTIVIPGNQEELASLGTADVPTEEGIYRAVLEVADAYGNTQLEEVYVILDKTGALIEDVEDKVVEVAKEDMDKAPEVNPSDYTITDNVDGSIPAENITCEPELRDAEKHEYIIHVSYTDRAGNESTADFLITLKAKKEEAETKASNDDSNGNSGNSGGNSSSDGSDSSEGSSTVGNDDGAPDTTDWDQDTATMIAAGYYVVTPTTRGGYQVMVHGGEESYGFDLLIQYLANMGYQPQGLAGGWISSDNDQYGIECTSVIPLITEDDPEFWN